ncbi:MAG: hypothetical protein COA78_19585 [Blastopirellula sp.]|nr:MAG: hypothetical protein COA78_19585 [Blastopirellula sp.]
MNDIELSYFSQLFFTVKYRLELNDEMIFNLTTLQHWRSQWHPKFKSWIKPQLQTGLKVKR